ncbi:beclin-1-like protein A [Bicyclus anynana]|uniref:Beclin-1-like protein A n=1 Tax=Bicyclus anynana TaxID=110368 RepID=A0A6J1PAN2_BICAN|nr:beclin-1-like protein A [Bicyclus anynana]XP_023954917.2 beclin-1-like protein A [Bicyclus anynana]
MNNEQSKMEPNSCGWILCASKRFPGKMYYFNIRNGEKAWSWDQTTDLQKRSRVNNQATNVIGTSDKQYNQIPNNSNSLESEQLLMGTSDHSSPMSNNNFANNTQARWNQRPNNILTSRQHERQMNSSDGSPMSENTFVNNARYEQLPNNILTSRQDEVQINSSDSSPMADNTFITNAQARYEQMPNNILTSRLHKRQMNSSDGSPMSDNTFINNAQARYDEIPNNILMSRQHKQQMNYSDSSPMSDNNLLNNTQARYEEIQSNIPTSRQYEQLQMNSNVICSPMTDNFHNNLQTGYMSTPNNKWIQQEKLHTESTDVPMSDSNCVFMDVAHNAFKSINNPLSKLPNQCRLSAQAMGDKINIDGQLGNKLMPNNNFSSKLPQWGNNQLKQSPTNFRYIGNTHNSKTLITNNTFSFGQRKCFQTESNDFGTPTINNDNLNENIQATYKVMPNSLFTMKQPKQLQSKNKKIGSKIQKATYKPLKNNPFSTKLSKSLKTKIDILRPQRNRSRVNLVDIKHLRNHSKSYFIKEWYIIPDVEVLLEDFDFLRSFISEDPTCMLMIPEVVMKKLQSLTDSRATVAKEVVQWLTKHAVCEINNQDEYPLTNVTINDRVLKFCIEAKIHHVVFITDKEFLREAAKLNGIPSYYISELTLMEKKENLFLQETERFDKFLISNSVQKCTITAIANNINENNNNAVAKNLNMPMSKSFGTQNEENTFDLTRPHESISIRSKFNQNVDRHNHRLITDCSNSYLGGHISINENNNSEENPHTAVVKQKHNFETNENTVSFESNEIQSTVVIEDNISNAGVDSNVMSKINEDYEKMEEELNEFCTTYSHLQDVINNSTLDEWSVCFVQIIEQFVNDILQGVKVNNFAPLPHCFQQGLKSLRDFYSWSKNVSMVIDKLIGLCGYRISKGIVRTNIKAEQFLRILGAGTLLIERINNVSHQSDMCGYYKEMLYNFINTLQTSEPDDFSDTMSIHFGLNLRF